MHFDAGFVGKFVTKQYLIQSSQTAKENDHTLLSDKQVSDKSIAKKPNKNKIM